MKHLPKIAAGLLGLAFIIFGLNFFLKFMAGGGSPPAGSPAAMFFGAIYTTGFLAFVKIIEIVGGILVAIPKTRNFGLLLLCPIVVGILAVNIFIVGGAAVFQVPVIAITLLSVYLLWDARAKFSNLSNN